MLNQDGITREQFLELLKEVKHPHLPVKIVFKPLTGWLYELRADVTDIVFEPKGYDTAFITNAFSDKNPVMTVQNIIDVLLSPDVTEKHVAFEIYGLDRTRINEQFICIGPEPCNVNITEEYDYVYINVNVAYALINK